MDMVLVRTTVGRKGDAQVLARRLVEAHAAACVHLVPIRSTYRWRGAIEEGAEWLVEARAPAALADVVATTMTQGHPYDVPLVERVASTVDAGYGAWAVSVTRAE